MRIVRPTSRFLAIFLWLSGLLLALHPTLFSQFLLIQGDIGDARFNHYVMEHSYRWISGHPTHSSFWDFPFYYPVKNVGTFGDILIGVSPIYWIFRALSFPPDTSFQLWQLSVLSLNYLSFYLLLKNIFHIDRLASALGAFLFAYGSPRTVHFLHPQFLPQFYCILCLFFAGRLLMAANQKLPMRQTLIPALCGCLSYILQWYSSFYYGWLLTFVLSLALMWSVVFQESRQVVVETIRHYWLLFSAAAVLCMAALYPMAARYREAASLVGLREFGHIHRFLPRPGGWLFMGEESWLYGWLASVSPFSQLPLNHEQQLGIGFCSTVVALTGLYFWRKQTPYRILALTLLSVILVSLVLPNGRSLWSLIYLYLPAAGAVRAVSRIALIVLILWAIGFALFFQKLLERSTVITHLLCLLIFVCCFVEQGRFHHRFDKLDMRRQIATLTSGLDKSNANCESFYYSSGGGTREPWKYQIDAMWAAVESGIPTINGYSGNTPPDWDLKDNRVHDRNDILRIASALKSWGTDTGLSIERTCWLRKYKIEGTNSVFEARPLR